MISKFLKKTSLTLQMSKQLFQFGTIRQFHLPDLGEKIKEATIKKWHYKEGDNVKEFDSIADVSTDKLFTAIPSPYNGKIYKRFHEEEQTCQIGELFLEIEVEDGVETQNVSAVKQTTDSGAIPALNEQQQQQQNKQNNLSQKAKIQFGREQTTNKDNNKQILVTPKVRKLLKDNNIDAKIISGSGPEGRILESDVLQFINEKQQSQQVQQAQKVAATMKSTTTPISEQQTIKKMNDFQRGMQKSMTVANSIPHFYIMEQVDVTDLAEMRNNFKNMKINITFMPLFIKAFSLALLDFPIVNSLYDPDKPFEYVQVKDHNISVAIDSPTGLVVPSIKKCQEKSILEIQAELTRIRLAAEQAKVGANDLFGGTFCVSNFGNICGTYCGPVILPPQVCIAGIGSMLEVPLYVNVNKNGIIVKELQPRKIINASFGCDHRVLDGATAARFVMKWKTLLTNPQMFILNLK